MSMANRVMTATEFRAKCLGLIEEVSKHGGTVTVTKRGVEVGVLRAYREPKRKAAKGKRAKEL